MLSPDSPQRLLRTSRLILRPFVLNDAVVVQRLAGDQAIADKTLNIPYPYEDGMAEQWISTHQAKFEAGENVDYAIILQSTEELIGAIGFVAINHRFDRAELGYWVGRPYWNNGYCTEAGHILLKFGFEDLNLNRIYAFHFKRNPASGRVMQKLGMVQEGVQRQHVKKWDIYEDIVTYGILKQDWVRS
jgi:ribosomal-protein-alanine N-acetyltransferase